jgi:hypothetical protein
MRPGSFSYRKRIYRRYSALESKSSNAILVIVTRLVPETPSLRLLSILCDRKEMAAASPSIVLMTPLAICSLAEVGSPLRFEPSPKPLHPTTPPRTTSGFLPSKRA